MDFDKFDQVVLFNLSTFLEYQDIYNLSIVSNKFKRLIYQDENIWLFKLKEFPYWSEQIELDMNSRKIYKLLIKLVKLYTDLKFDGTIYQLYRAKELLLYDEYIEIIPPEIEMLINAERLVLDCNCIKRLPKQMFNLNKLVELDLSKNCIEILPPEIGNLKNLRILWLEYNNIEELPDEIFTLINLIEIHSSYNKIKTLSPKIGNLVNLRFLVLSNNELTTIPIEILNLKNIEFVGLAKNRIKICPEEIINKDGVFLDKQRI